MERHKLFSAVSLFVGRVGVWRVSTASVQIQKPEDSGSFDDGGPRVLDGVSQIDKRGDITVDMELGINGKYALLSGGEYDKKREILKSNCVYRAPRKM